jgi:hypothetical protein
VVGLHGLGDHVARVVVGHAIKVQVALGLINENEKKIVSLKKKER